MPNLMVAKMRWKWIWFSIPKDQSADSVKKSACDEKGDGPHAKLFINGTKQENDHPAHQQIADVRHQDRNLRKENGLECDKENRQAPNDAKQNPTGCPVEDGQTKWSVGACNEQVNGIMVENAQDAQVFLE